MEKMVLSAENVSEVAKEIEKHIHAPHPRKRKWYHSLEVWKDGQPWDWKEIEEPGVVRGKDFLWVGSPNTPMMVQMVDGDEIYFGKCPFTGYTSYLIITHKNGGVDIIRPN